MTTGRINQVAIVARCACSTLRSRSRSRECRHVGETGQEDLLRGNSRAPYPPPRPAAPCVQACLRRTAPTQQLSFFGSSVTTSRANDPSILRRPGEARSLARSRAPNHPRGQLTGATTTTASPPCLKKTVSSHAHTHIHARRHATRHSVLNSHARTLRSRRAVYPPHRAARAVLRSSTRGPSLVSEDCHEEPSGGRNNHVTLRRHSRLRKPATPRAHPSRGPRGPLNPPHTHPGKQACDDTPTEPDVPPHPSLGAGEG